MEEGRFPTMAVNDADSHLMELSDFLTAYCDPALRSAMPLLFDPDDPAAYGGLGAPPPGTAGHPADVVDELRALGSGLLRGPKWHRALGAFNPAERSEVLDLLGFSSQVVFSSFAGSRLFAETDLDVRYGAARAHNRGMAEFVAGDERLLGVATVPLDDPERAASELDAALGAGLRLVWLAADAPGGRSPGHPDHDGVWARLAEAGVPFVLHVGSSQLSIPDEWMNDGVAGRPTARGGAEVVGSKDMTTIFHPAERFLSVLVLDGVLERFPRLRGACIELGAGWVPSMLERLDHIVSIWSRSEPHLAAFTRMPSEQAIDQLRFTAYPFEDVGTLIERSDPRLYMFGSDYPHAEGGRDPIGRFDASLARFEPGVRRRFYATNLAELMGSAPDPTGAAT
ncbi:MAG: amidohydrolase family protein [Acidimicrobiales bacterium]